MASKSAYRLGAWVLAIVATTIAALIVYLMVQFPEALEDQSSKLSFTHQILWLLLLLSSFAVRWRTSPGQTLRHIAIWVVIAATIGAGYSFRHEFKTVGNRMLFELLPHRGQVGDNQITFRARENGHFVVEAQVDGTALRFLVDTGATDVVLSPADAERLGFDLSSLSFTRLYNTANGTVRGAPVRLRQVSLGPIELRDVRASINEAPMSSSLLGMSFLSRLSGFEIRGDSLTLIP